MTNDADLPTRTMDPHERQFLSLLITAGVALYRQRAKEAAAGRASTPAPASQEAPKPKPRKPRK